MRSRPKHVHQPATRQNLVKVTVHCFFFELQSVEHISLVQRGESFSSSWIQIHGLLSTYSPAKKKARYLFSSGLFSACAAYLAPQPGLEPGTYGLTVRRSTN